MSRTSDCIVPAQPGVTGLLLEVPDMQSQSARHVVVFTNSLLYAVGLLLYLFTISNLNGTV